jgi:hypothetical protein
LSFLFLFFYQIKQQLPGISARKKYLIQPPGRKAMCPQRCGHAFVLRARAKITSDFKRRCILPGGVAKARNMLDIPALSRLARQAPQRLKSVN